MTYDVASTKADKFSRALPHAACWKGEDAYKILRIEALVGDSAIFLATHTPIEGFDVAGERAAAITSRTEAGVLAALSQRDLKHAFCVVQGEPGSGKSHLIRWLAVKWPREENELDRPILIRRADSSLEGSLRELRDRLPPNYRSLFDRIGVKQQATMSGRIADFVSNLTNTLEPEYYETAPEDVDFCRAFDPAAILRLPGVRSDWKAPGRIVRLLSGADGERNSATATFDVYDVANLVQIAAQSRALSSGAATFTTRAQKEFEAIESCEREGLNGYEALNARRAEMPYSARFVDALNRRRNRAVQNSLGVSAQELRSVFIDLRRAMKKDGLRLVLLLEDITAWEGLDDSLIDVLVTDARIDTSVASQSSGEVEEAKESDLCDLISVVGVTPYYYGLLRSNYKQRITHEIKLGRDQGGKLQDVASMRDTGDRLRFVVRYLAATRAGPDDLSRWGAEARAHPSRPPPNACADCPVHDGCHAAFGHVDGVGLYPFSRNAIGHFYDALKPRDGDMTWRTPRGVIQAILAPTLTRPEALDQGVYPIAEIETHHGIDSDQGLVGGATDTLLRSRVDDLELRERLRRLLAFWGDRHRSDTSVGSNGELSFAGIPREIFESFGLPWLGGAVADEFGDDPTQEQSDEAAEDSPLPIDAGHVDEGDANPSAPAGPFSDPAAPGGNAPRNEAAQATGSSEQTAGPQPPVRDRSPRATPTDKPRSPAPRKPPPADIVAFQDDVAQYQRAVDSKKPAAPRSPSTWNELAYSLVHLLDPRSLGINRYLFTRLFTTELVKIEGTGQVRKYHLSLKPEIWLLRGLESCLHLRNTAYLEDKPSAEQDYHHRCVSRCVMRLQSIVQAHIDRRVPALDSGERWDIAGAITEIIAVRNWLRGVSSPSDPLDAQWSAVLEDEPVATADPDSRVGSWKELVDQTSPRQRDLRDILRQMVNVPQGESAGFGLADAGPAVRALVALGNSLRVGAWPSRTVEFHGDNVLDAVPQILSSIKDKLRSIPVDEERRLKRLAGSIEEHRRGLGLKAHLERLNNTIKEVSNSLPTAAGPSVRAWGDSYAGLAKVARLDKELEVVEHALIQLLEPTSDPPPARSAILAAVAALPASRIASVAESFEKGEQTVKELLSHVADLADGDAGSTHDESAKGLPAVHKAGAELADVANAALIDWEGGSA